MPVVKTFHCDNCGEFQAPLSICPSCKRRAKRSGIAEIVASRQAPGVSSAKYRNSNRLLETALTEQGLVDYTNRNCHAGEAGKPTFRSEWQHSSGLHVGYGAEFLHKVSGGAQLAQLDLDSVKTGTPIYNPAPAQAALEAAKLSAITTANAKVGVSAQRNPHLSARTTIERRA